jgi:outer membrane protein assembly factor BamB
MELRAVPDSGVRLTLPKLLQLRTSSVMLVFSSSSTTEAMFSPVLKALPMNSRLPASLVICFWLALVLTASLFASNASAENWPRYRGTDGGGVSPQAGIPVEWSEGDYSWATSLPGEGHSSPVIWNRHLFLTTATDEGQVRHLCCLDSMTGAIRWSRAAGFNSNRKHSKNSFASSTPATDGERVYVAFADEERFALAAYDLNGQLSWRTWLGPFVSQHGQGASPLVFEDLVIIANDQDGPSSIVACDRRTGQVVWSTMRTAREASYATPLLIEFKNQKPQLVCLSGATGLTSLDPWTGQMNWTSGELPQRTVASPAFAQGLIYATCGQGGKGTRLIGVDPSGTGDVAETHIKIRRDKELPYVPAMIGFGELLFLWNDNGLITCLDPKTNKNVWQERVGGNFSGSPICIDGKLYNIEESGKVVVVEAGPQFKLLGESPLGDPSYSTPAVANDRLYLRSFHKLSCLTSKLAKSAASQ